MSSSRRRQFFLILVTLVTLGATALVAAAGRTSTPIPEAWSATWAAALTPAGAGASNDGFKDQTIRMFVHTSAGGSQARVRLSNRYGEQDLLIGEVTVGLPWPDSGPGDLQPGSIQDATFSGQKSIVIPAGGTAVSDPVLMDVPASQDLAVSIYLPEETGPATWHVYSKETAYVGDGDHAASPSGADLPETRTSWFYLTGVDVLNDSGQGTIAVLGDSITDGLKSTANADHRWTDYLGARLNREAPDGRAPGVVNLGLSGNRLGRDGSTIGFPELGVNASARFYQDVLAQPGLRIVIVELGINDIWISRQDADFIIAQLQQLAIKAHLAGVKLYVCTLMPWKAFSSREGVINYTPELDSVRLKVNSYLRTSSDFDGVIDFDLAMRDPADPSQLRPEFNSGDDIHPNDAGNEAMAGSFSLDLLLKTGDMEDAS